MANLVFDFLHHYQRGERRESDPANAYQYDEGHLIEAVLPETVTSVELHYWARGMEEAEAYTPSSITANDDGSYTVIGSVPNKFFKTDGDLRVYIVVNDAEASITTYEGKIHVVHRAMPDDYVYDDPENEATRILTEAQAAATTATQQAQAASNSADQAQQSAETLSESVEQIATNTQDITALKEDFYDSLVTDTASGSIASFPDGADNVPVKSLTVDIEPVQSGSGDPSPDNVRPITGWDGVKVTRTGKNLFDKSNTANILNNTDFSGATIGVGSQRCVVFIPCKPNRTYMASRKAGLTNERFAIGYTTELPAVGVAVANVTLAPNSQTVGNLMSLSVTTGSDAKYVVVWAYWDNTTGALDDLQIELGSTATAYEPYNGEQYTIDLNGTVYGGTLDVTTGVLTVDTKELTINSSDGFELYSIGSNTTVFRKLNAVNENITENGEISNILKFHVSAYSAQDGRENTFVLGASKSLFIQMPNTVASTITKLNTFISSNPVTVVYKLATPQTIQLTAQEVRTPLGQNNIWSDSGDVEVEYRADTKLYIEKLTAPTEDDMIADHAISANSFFMVGNTLYRATTAIASGATITVGTNATKLSLSDALNALA